TVLLVGPVFDPGIGQQGGLESLAGHQHAQGGGNELAGTLGKVLKRADLRYAVGGGHRNVGWLSFRRRGRRWWCRGRNGSRGGSNAPGGDGILSTGGCERSLRLRRRKRCGRWSGGDLGRAG